MTLSEIIAQAHELMHQYGDLEVKLMRIDSSEASLIDVSLLHSIHDYEGIMLSGDTFEEECIIVDEA